MKRFLLPLAIAAGLFGSSGLSAHGGTYRGPGDTVPPSGSGATAPTAPTGPQRPTAPSTPTAPAPASPTTPTTPNLPSAPANTTVKRATTGGGDTGPDLTIWEFWWEFNKQPFLNLKAKVQSGGNETGEGDILVGLGAANPKESTYRPTTAVVQGTIVPTLLDALERESNVDLLSSCLISLGKIGGSPEIPTGMNPLLHHKNQEIAETAAISFGILQSEETLPLLLDILSDTARGRKVVGKESGVPLRTRTFAAYGLALIGYSTSKAELKQRIADQLWHTLTTDQDRLKDLKVACVIGTGLLRLDDPSVALRNLSAFLDDEEGDFLVRAHAPNAIAKLLHESNAGSEARAPYVEQFIRLLDTRGTSAEIRQSCVQALGMVTRGTDDFAPTVFDKLAAIAGKGRDQQERNFTAISMAYLGANPPLDNPMAEKVTGFLVNQLAKGASTYRPWAGLALGVMAFKVSDKGGTFSALAMRQVRDRFLKEKNPSRKSCFAVSLGLMKNETAASDIRDAMVASRNPKFQGYAAVALGLMNARQYKEDIAKIVAGSKRLPDLLQQAATGLGLMSDREVVGQLIDLMRPGDSTATPPLAVLAAAANALGFIGDTSSVRPLVELVQDKETTGLARAFAAVALGTVADEEPLPWNSKIAEDLNYRAAVSTLVDASGGTGVLDIL